MGDNVERELLIGYQGARVRLDLRDIHRPRSRRGSLGEGDHSSVWIYGEALQYTRNGG